MHSCSCSERTHAAAGFSGPLNKRGRGPKRAKELQADFLSLLGAGKRASPVPCTPGSARQLAGEWREPVERWRRTVGAVSPFHRLLTCPGAGTAAAPQRYALRHPNPTPFPEMQPTVGKFPHAIFLAYKVLRCRASFEEGEKWSCRGRLAGKRSSPGAAHSQAPGTLRTSRGQARMQQEALHRTGKSEASTDRVRRCLIYPRPPGGQQQVLPQLFHHPASTCRFRAHRARRGPRFASRSPLHVPLHPKSLHGPRWAPSSG